MKGILKKIWIVFVVFIISISSVLKANAKDDFPKVNSEYYLMLNLTNNSIEFEKGQNEKIYPASMTKVMTCLLVIENTRHFDKIITITNNDLKGLDDAHSSRAGFMVGEKVTVEDALHGALLASGGDAARAIARHMAGTEKEFVNIMNKKAAFLGMKDTHYTNPIGLHDDDHYTTLHDMAILFEYAMKNEKFKEIVSCPEYHVKSNKHENLGFLNSMYYIMEHHDIDHTYMIGQKSGYTPEAGLCLSSMLEKDGQKYLLVTAKADKEKNEVGNFQDAQVLYDYVLGKNSKNFLVKKGETIGKISTGKILKGIKTIEASEDIFAVTSKDKDIKWEFTPSSSKLYITKGSIIGKITAEREGKQIFEKNIYAQHLILSRDIIVVGLIGIVLCISTIVYFIRGGYHAKRNYKKNK